MPEVQKPVLGQDKEKWKPLLGMEGKYEVSNIGRVKSLVGRWGYGREGMIMKLRPSNGYRVVCIDRGRGQRPVSVHRLVLESFDRPARAKEQCRHLNAIRSDNRLVNLAWGTCKENRADTYRHGSIQLGENNPCSKFTDKQVRESVKLIEDGMSFEKAGRCMKISGKIIARWYRGEVRWASTGMERAKKGIRRVRSRYHADENMRRM